LYCGKPFQVYKWQQKKYCCPKHRLADWPRIKALKRGIGVEKLYEGCVICGNKELPILEIHHKDGNRENKSPDNLVVLCPNCHKKVHRGIIKL
jgi:5-methylcytosine-specific restriction endonuclease McrA